MSINNKKNTVRRKMSVRDYVTFINFLETGKVEMDLSEYDPAALDKSETRTMYLTAEQKKELPNFVKDYSRGVTVKKILDGIPKNGCGNLVSGTPDDVPPSIGIKRVAEASVVEEKKDQPWLIDKTGRFELENVDLSIFIKSIEEGDLCLEKLLELIDDNERKTVMTKANLFYCSEPIDQKAYMPNEDTDLFYILDVAERRHKAIVCIMEEPEPSEEETIERFCNCYLSNITGYNDELRSFSRGDGNIKVVDNKLMFEDDDEEDPEEPKVIDYDNAESLINDLFWLAREKRIDRDKIFNVFGKKISVSKLLQKAYTTNPDMLPNGKRFFKTRRAAYEAGELQI